jgi:hypothetical protein
MLLEVKTPKEVTVGSPICYCLKTEQWVPHEKWKHRKKYLCKIAKAISVPDALGNLKIHTTLPMSSIGVRLF